MEGKTILFGTILSVFLMLITPTISTVNANISEKQITENNLKKLNNFKDRIKNMKELNLDILLTRLLGLMITLTSIFFFSAYITGGVFAFIFVFSMMGLISGLNNGEIPQRMLAGAKIGIICPFSNFVLGMNLLFGEGDNFEEITDVAMEEKAVKTYIFLLGYLFGLSDSPDPELI